MAGAGGGCAAVCAGPYRARPGVRRSANGPRGGARAGRSPAGGGAAGGPRTGGGAAGAGGGDGGDGAALLYAGLLGGTGYDAGRGIALGPRGRGGYVVGETLSADFPTTPGALGELPGGGRDGFVTKLALDARYDD